MFSQKDESLRLKSGITLPYFIINMGGVNFEFQQYEFNGKLLGMNHYLYHGPFTPRNLKGNFNSLHMVSERDEYFIYSRESRVFPNPKIIMHSQGHKPPKYLSAGGNHEQLLILHEFINE